MNRIIVSLTSFPERIHCIEETLLSIFKQSIKPDLVVLYLSKEEFNVPINNLCNNKSFIIKYVNGNLMSHKKYFYALQEFKDDVVITLDDDMIYHEKTIETLLKFHQKYPTYVIANRTRFIAINDDKVESYYNRPTNSPIDAPSLLLLGTGVLGILYPPNCFDEFTFNTKLIEENCLTNDDLWLKINEIRLEIPTVLTDLDKTLNFRSSTQDNKLCYSNFLSDNCNKDFAKLTNLFNINLKDIFIKEYFKNKKRKIYDGRYSAGYLLKGNIYCKYLKFYSSCFNEFKATLCANKVGLKTRTPYGYTQSPSLILFDYIKGKRLRRDCVLNEGVLKGMEAAINKIQLIKLSLKNNYFDDCLDALEKSGIALDNEIKILSEINEEVFVHGDLNFNNIIKNKNEYYVIDFENSCLGPSWWDTCYFLANFKVNKIDKKILSKLNDDTINRIILIIKIRIGRRIRKKMEISDLLDELDDWLRFKQNRINLNLISV